MARTVPCRAVPWCRRKCAVYRLLRREQAPALRVCAQIEHTAKSKFEMELQQRKGKSPEILWQFLQQTRGKCCEALYNGAKTWYHLIDNPLSKLTDINFVVTVSAEKAELPEFLKKYV